MWRVSETVLLFIALLLTGRGMWAHAQVSDREPEGLRYTYSFDTTLESKYIWRGQRLTDGWNLQSSGTFGANGFSVNLWAKLDLEAVSEGDRRLLGENPEALDTTGKGLQGRFSEVDLMFSYVRQLAGMTFEAGMVSYVMPYNLDSCPSTTEVYARLALDPLPLAPAVSVNVDVDESRERGGSGLYVDVAAGHSLPLSGSRFKSVDISGRLGIAGSGFARYCYDSEKSGPHDLSLSLSLPVEISDGWSSTFFLSCSSLIGRFRDFQYVNPRDLHRGSAGSPSSYADTIWGGIVIAFEP
ncbi:MAG TPA: hypothetical protein PLP42_19535 [Acidobacteriota bacterium]|nr:hypothetical protein [Acidobacteriota bacterium]